MKYDGNNLLEVVEAHQRWLHDETDEHGVIRDDLRADFSGADLRGYHLASVCLYGANFRGANLYQADLTQCDLARADLTGANLFGARIEQACLHSAIGVPFVPIACPDTGSFVGWKQAVLARDGEVTQKHVILKLLIPEDASRTSDTKRECRASKVRVLEIQAMDGTVLADEQTGETVYAVSRKHPAVEYHVGRETVAVNVYPGDFQRFGDGAWHYNNGIFFFINRREAELYLTAGEDPDGNPIDISNAAREYAIREGLIYGQDS